MATHISLEQFITRERASIAKPEPRSGIIESIRSRIQPRITEREKAEFFTQLSVMLQARVSLHRSLSILGKQTKSERLRDVIGKLESRIQKGDSFSSALKDQPKMFEELVVVTAEVGQESGKLAEVLSNLALHLEKIVALKRKFTQALTYPALVISVAGLTVTFLLVFIVPTFAEMFKNFQVELPSSTKVVLALSRFLTNYGPYATIGLAIGLYAFRKALTSKPAKRKIEIWSMRIPFIGDVLLKNHVARFCRTLGTLLQAQVPLVDALSVTQRIASNQDVREEIGELIKHVKRGKAVAEPLVESKFFPPMVGQMIAVGEETSELDAMLLKVADYYERELDGKVEALSSLIEPVIVVILGLLVAAILISMYLPMFELVNVVGGGG